MAYVPSSVLSPPPQSLGLAAIASIGLHVGGVIIFAGWTLLCSTGEPVRDIRPSIEISFAEMKHAPGLPQLAMRTPTPPSLDSQPAPAPAPEPQPVAPEPPPPRESDLVIHTPEPPPAPQSPAPVVPTPAPDNSAERQQALDRMRADQDRADRLAELQDRARTGDHNQEATDPNATGSENLGSASGNPSDPELARWRAMTQTRFADVFSPIHNDPGLLAKVRVTIDPSSGMIRSTRVLQSSGNASFDAAAERSAKSLIRIELPPSRFREMVGSNLDITYEPK